MTRNQVLRQLKTAPQDFVVDIGGGHRPFWRADLVIEKYPFDHSLHRNQPMEFPPVPVIKADALSLPINEGGCDLIFASHLIEHLPDPKGFLTEIRRCSRMVYLEFPSRYRELMFAWSFHEWLVEVEGCTLKFYRNDLPQLFGDLFHKEFDAALGAWSDARHEHLNTWVYCRSDELECQFPSETASSWVLSHSPLGASKINFADSIHRPRYTLRESLAFLAQSMLPVSLYESLSRKQAHASTPVPLSDSVLRRLMCLYCRHNELRRFGATVTCSCGAEYSQDRGVFDFDVLDRAGHIPGTQPSYTLKQA